ncbi:unnamed protein product [Closterium sp. Naga37s-1]|nr:unnamed protein product [Closterium sp. Naga37s-1]
MNAKLTHTLLTFLLLSPSLLPPFSAGAAYVNAKAYERGLPDSMLPVAAYVNANAYSNALPDVYAACQAVAACVNANAYSNALPDVYAACQAVAACVNANAYSNALPDVYAACQAGAAYVNANAYSSTLPGLYAACQARAAYVNANAYSSALLDLYAARAMAPQLFKPHLFLGLALTATGAPFEAVKSYETAMAMNPDVKEGWTNWGQTMKEIAMFNESERCYKRALDVDKGFLLAYKLWAKLRHTVGDHRGVIRLLQEGLKHHPNNVELRYFEASCFHATGDFSQAVRLYDSILSLQTSGDERFQYLAFYQREIAAYMAVNVNAPFSHFSLDDHFNRVFKARSESSHLPYVHGTRCMHAPLPHSRIPHLPFSHFSLDDHFNRVFKARFVSSHLPIIMCTAHYACTSHSLAPPSLSRLQGKLAFSCQVKFMTFKPGFCALHASLTTHSLHISHLPPTTGGLGQRTEGWANAQFPGHLPSRGYQMQDIQAVFRVRRQQHRRKGEKRFEANRAALLKQADEIGRLVQYNTTGFLGNMRQVSKSEKEVPLLSEIHPLLLPVACLLLPGLTLAPFFF